ncbi:phenol hydroxylase [Acrodontium crateriforme]|uniref:Phenol hydroxylase n=1 Tax=Acrodontium crateriforme TaxID=150365 RepID=A0AAQ3RC66_9PEZI|nr:phenol hydroxylase [Acrodontium crateriforme]
MEGLSRRSSRQALLMTDDTNSLTSFPDPSTASPLLQPQSNNSNEPLNGLLDTFGPTIFDEQNDAAVMDPQTLSAAQPDVLRGIIHHHGAVELVNRLATLLAQRDAHITALTRLAEEYNIPRERIVDASSRAKQTERRRLSLAAAAADELVPASGSQSRSDSSERLAPIRSTGSGGGSVRAFTKMFAGTGRRPRPPSTSSRSSSRHPPLLVRPERPHSIDARSIQSTDSGGWKTSLFSNSSRPRQDSRVTKEPVELLTQHDRDQLPPTLSNLSKDPHEAQWNRFLLKLVETREQNGERDEGGEMIGASRFGQEGAVGQQKLNTLTRLVVGGVPMSLRYPIWMELTNTHAMVRPGDYQHFLREREKVNQAEIEDIMKDVPRTLTSKYDFYNGKGYKRLKEVLVAFVGKYDGLGYTQGLNTIAGYLLLAIPIEEDAFWVMCNIIENYFPAEYFSKAAQMNGPLADNVLLRQYVKEILPSLAKRMDELEIAEDRTVPLNWFFTAFSTVLSQEALMRIWDVWLCLPQQKTFIFNVALALLMQNAAQLMECESDGDYWAVIDQCTTRLNDEPEQISELIKQAFALKKKLENAEDRRAVEFKILRRKRDSMEVLYDAT